MVERDSMTIQRPFYSILRDTDRIIDEFFGVSENGKPARYATRKAFLDPSLATSAGNARDLLVGLHQQVELNWQQSSYRPHAASTQNWRCKSHAHYTEIRRGLEVILEREIVKALGTPPLFNNVPTSSGLCGPSHDKARNIDLVYSSVDSEFTFLELKWDKGAGTPVFAAVEIVVRGILNMFSRLHRKEMSYGHTMPMLEAKLVHLRVLAPISYYSDPVDLRWLECRLNEGFQEYAGLFPEAGLALDFGFEVFPPNLKPPFVGDEVRSAFCSRHPAYVPVSK